MVEAQAGSLLGQSSAGNTQKDEQDVSSRTIIIRRHVPDDLLSSYPLRDMTGTVFRTFNSDEEV